MRGPMSDATRKKLSEACKGRPSPNKGKKMSEEQKKKLSEAGKRDPVRRKPKSNETKKKISLSRKRYYEKHPEDLIVRRERMKGEKNPMYGRTGYWKHNTLPNHVVEMLRTVNKGRKHSEEWKEDQSRKMSGKGNPSYGKTGELSPLYGLTKEDIPALSHAGVNHPLYGKTGPLAPNWRDGKSFEPYCYKFNKELKDSIKSKYGYNCFLCGSHHSSYNLCVHHIDYNKMQGCSFDQRYLLVPLCRKCHGESNFNRWYWFNLMISYFAINQDINFGLCCELYVKKCI